MITEVEGKKPESLSESLRWVKGLLTDFISQKERLIELERLVEKFSHVMSVQT